MAQGFDAWGIPSNLSDGNDTFGLPLAYTGLPYDQEAAGLTYAHARWYDAGQGRFVSRDPLGGSLAAPASQNRYAYALDNPTTYLDPSGLGTISGAGGGVGGGGPVASACGGCALALNPATTPQASTTASSSAASGPHTLSGMLIYVGQTLANWAFGWIALLTAIGAAVCAEVASCQRPLRSWLWWLPLLRQ